MSEGFSQYTDKTLIGTWNRLKTGLEEINTTIKDGTFHTVKEKGGAPPSQAGQMIMWMALQVDAELNKRNIKH